MYLKKLLLSTVFILFTGFFSQSFAQFGEPKVRTLDSPRNLYDEGFKSGFGFNIAVNDFGIGVGGQYRKVLSPDIEGLITLKIQGIKDPSEQIFIDFFFGSRSIPDKYKRVTSFPLLFGIKHRLFANQVSDNYRFYTAVSAGPTLALAFPYFEDRNGNGYQESIFIFPSELAERNYDIFTGWKNPESHWGVAGEVLIGLDFGSNFANLQSAQFGYSFNYFQNGIQIMQPNRPSFDQNGQFIVDNGNIVVEPSNSPRKYFGAAQISFVFGWMWD